MSSPPRRQFDLALAGGLCERGEEALRTAEITEAIAAGQTASKLLAPFADHAAGGLAVRAGILTVDGLALADRLREAEAVAIQTVAAASALCSRSQWEALAQHRRGEVTEMLRKYGDAGMVFSSLEAALVGEEWAAATRLSCCNHMISIGVHNCDPIIAAEGIRRGAKLRGEVDDADEVASWLQWRGIYESRRGDFERSVDTLRESFALRAKTARRTITRGFLDAEIAHIERGPEAGLAALEEALDRASGAGLVRHTRAADRHMSRLRAR